MHRERLEDGTCDSNYFLSMLDKGRRQKGSILRRKQAEQSGDQREKQILIELIVTQRV